MPKRKSATLLADASADPINRRWRRFFLWALLLILIASAAGTSGALHRLPWSKPGFHTLPELLASNKFRGFELLQEPDRPGPYQEKGVTSAGKGEPVFGSFWADGKQRRFNIAAVPGAELRVVGLMPEDGELTYMVLRSTASAAGQK
jgi:hypothetical protein